MSTLRLSDLKRAAVLCFVALSASVAGFGQAEEDLLYAVHVNRGLFFEIQVYDSKFQRVRTPAAEDHAGGLYGVIFLQIGDAWTGVDRQGATVAKFPTGVNVLGQSADGMVLVSKSGARGSPRLAGYMNLKGELYCGTWYEEARPFSDDVAIVRTEGVWAVLDRSCRLTKIPGAKYVSSFSEGLAWAEREGKRQWITKDGSSSLELQFDDAAHFREGLAPVSLDGRRWGVIDRMGKFVVEPSYDAIFDFREGYAAFKKAQRWGFMDTRGQVVIPPSFDYAWGFQNGLAPVVQGKLWGYVKPDGKFAIPPRFKLASPFSKAGIAAVGIPPEGNDIGVEFGGPPPIDALIDRQGKVWVIGRTGGAPRAR